MKLTKILLLSGLAALGAVALHSHPELDDSTYRAVVAGKPRAGDVVFTRIGGPVFARVAATTMSWTSHVGIIVDYRDGDWVVAESGIPVVRMTPLRAFLGHSENHAFAIKRLKNEPTDEDLRVMRMFAESQLGRFYALGFDLESNRTFCSKFVHDVVYVGTRQSIGEVETFDHLLHRNPAAPLGFWKAWFLGSIPWKRTTITPASELESPLLVTVVQNRV